MATLKKIPFDLSIIAEAFKLERSTDCKELDIWLKKQYELTQPELDLLHKVNVEMLSSSDYLNEEEIKIRLIAPLLQIADIDQGNEIRVFFERSLSAEVEGYQLSVVCDCMVAASTIFKTPTHPYFFLQEFKKAKGEKRDPEAQMLVAMLAAQKANADNQPIYGGFLIGPIWRLAVLMGNNYCTSRQFFAADFEDLQRIVFALRSLKGLILGR
ncbi:hypothetical protein [Haliscomenobacter hydrossis]|uniref:Uncharacterized protein n=1 Tax=Haliscomenobacter hydrossis (strain ATCC 27775 / DSM 1100 / LMG 10767 / O) TaxID=760192 RepID=F4KWA6_HALH1|nr:hypothetical protein [Haliscomenobacter hydrossis]AEE49294.1 hypothetical protein Halhy_1399 [Haliscomenobacter hydrossis DSM 1100]